MSRFQRAATIAGPLLVLLLPAAPARAELLPVTWVSETGDDLHACSHPAPCRNLQAALSKTKAGGEIRVVRSGVPPGQFGSVIIDKSVSIVGNGVQVGLSPLHTAAIEISAGANDVVNLRGLVVSGIIDGLSAIAFKSGAALHIQNCEIRGPDGALDGQGIAFVPSGNSDLYISDTLIADNRVIPPDPNAQRFGIVINTYSGIGARVVLDRVQVKNNAVGIMIFAGDSGAAIRVVMRNSVVAGNATGVSMRVLLPSIVDLVVDGSNIANNGDAGIELTENTTAHVTNSTISGNATGIRSVSGGVLDLRPNNTVVGNGINVEGPPLNQ